jgi:hypothetical protein
MSTEPVRTAIESGVLTITLDRPARRNAMDAATVDGLHHALADADVNADVRVVAIRGAGKDFCAGADLQELLDTVDQSLADHEAHAQQLPHPDTARARRRISTGGGFGPLWGAGGELFYTGYSGDFATGNKMMAVQIDLQSAGVGAPRVLFEGPYEYGPAVRFYDVTPDGRRFLMLKPRPGAERREVMVVLNWFEELKAKMAASR